MAISVNTVYNSWGSNPTVAYKLPYSAITDQGAADVFRVQTGYDALQTIYGADAAKYAQPAQPTVSVYNGNAALYQVSGGLTVASDATRGGNPSKAAASYVMPPTTLYSGQLDAGDPRKRDNNVAYQNILAVTGNVLDKSTNNQKFNEFKSSAPVYESVDVLQNTVNPYLKQNNNGFKFSSSDLSDSSSALSQLVFSGQKLESPTESAAIFGNTWDPGAGEPNFNYNQLLKTYSIVDGKTKQVMPNLPQKQAAQLVANEIRKADAQASVQKAFTTSLDGPYFNVQYDMAGIPHVRTYGVDYPYDYAQLQPILQATDATDFFAKAIQYYAQNDNDQIGTPDFNVSAPPSVNLRFRSGGGLSISGRGFSLSF